MENQIRSSRKRLQYTIIVSARRWWPFVVVPLAACLSTNDPSSPSVGIAKQAFTGRDVPSSTVIVPNGQYTWKPTVFDSSTGAHITQTHIAVSPDGAFVLLAPSKQSAQMFVGPLALRDEMVNTQNNLQTVDFSNLATGTTIKLNTSNPSCPSGYECTLGGLGAVTFDPRHGLGPFPVEDKMQCPASAGSAEVVAVPNGALDCYRMLVYAQIRKKKGAEVQYHLAVAPMDLALDRDTHTITFAKFRAKFQSIKVDGGTEIEARQNMKDEFSDHFTATADGRLLVFGTQPRYTWSADPLALTNFDPPAPLWCASNADPTRKVRLDPSSTTDCSSEAVDPECVRFNQAYPIFRNAFTFADGTPIAPGVACSYSSILPTEPPLTACDYPWITPDGTDLFCNAGSISALAMIGQSTRGTLQHIDAQAQTTQQRYCQKTMTDNLSCSVAGPAGALGAAACSPRGIDGPNCGGEVDVQTTLGTQRIASIGTATGPWRHRGPQGNTTRFPLMHRAPSLMMMSRNTAPKRSGVDATAPFTYFEVATDVAADPDFVAFFHMNEAIKPTTPGTAESQWHRLAPFGDSSPADDVRAMHTADAGGHAYVGTLNDCAKFPFDRFGHIEHPDTAPPNPGFLGRAIYFEVPAGKVEFDERGPHTVREARKSMTLELAVSHHNLTTTTGKIVLVRAKDSFELSFDPTAQSVTFSVTGATTAATFIGGASDPPMIPAATNEYTPRYTHFALTYAGHASKPEATVNLYRNGVFFGTQLMTGTNLLPAPTGPKPVCIGPGCGSSTDCPESTPASPAEVLIDEVGISSVVRSNEYIAAAALATGPTDVFSSTDSVPWFDNVPPDLDAADLRVPDELRNFIEGAPDLAAQSARFARLVALGKALFKDDVLTVNADVCVKKKPGHSCATCHDANNFFANGDVRFDEDVNGVLLDTNTPSLVGRAFSTRQLKDRSEPSLLHQAARVIEDPREMGGKFQEILRCLNDESSSREVIPPGHAPNDAWTYRRWFRHAFERNGDVKKQEVLAALAAYELRLISGGSPVDEMLDSNAASPLAKGFRIFQGKGRCAGCHAGKNFTDELRHVTRAGGKAIKTPSLRNVQHTGPYFHDGSKSGLRVVIEHYNGCGADADGHCAPELVALGLAEDEIVALEDFLEGLSGPNPNP